MLFERLMTVTTMNALREILTINKLIIYIFFLICLIARGQSYTIHHKFFFLKYKKKQDFVDFLMTGARKD